MKLRTPASSILLALFERLRRARARQSLGGAAALFSVFVTAACSPPLPEEGSAAAELYRSRCGSCHRPIAPSSLKFPPWEMILPRMDERLKQAGAPPLSAAERETIVAYLRKYGG